MRTIEYKYFKSKTFDDLPRQGWKIHISGYEKNYNYILRLVSEYCYKNNITFKYINLKEIAMQFRKESQISNTGKWITIYPINNANFKTIVKDLEQILKKQKGPMILTNRRYKDSIIYYRFGVIRCLDNFENYLIDSQGVLYKDRGKNYFTCPLFDKDPFGIKIGKNRKKSEVILNDKYLVKEGIHFSNFGGIYLAENVKSRKKVIIKEARPFVGYSLSETAIKMRKKERLYMLKFENIDCFPKFIEEFYIDNNYFLVCENIEGITLENLRSIESPCLYSVNDKIGLAMCYEKYNLIIKRMLEILKLMHKENTLIQDISLDNFILDKNLKIYFIDMETLFYLDNNKQKIFVKPMIENNFNRFENDYLGLLLLIVEMLCPPIAEFTIYSGNLTDLVKLLNCFYEVYKVPQVIVLQINSIFKKLQIDNVQTKIDNIQTTIGTSLSRDYKLLIRGIRGIEEGVSETLIKIHEKSNQLLMKVWNSFSNNEVNDITTKSLVEFYSTKKEDVNNGLIGGRLGICFLNITLFERTKKNLYLKEANLGIREVILTRQISKGLYTIQTNQKSNTYSPHVGSGTGGLIKVILAYLDNVDDQYLRDELNCIFDNFNVNYTRYLTYDNGMIGIIDCFIDMYQYTKNDKFLLEANKKYNIFRKFKIPKNKGYVHPDGYYKGEKDAGWH